MLSTLLPDFHTTFQIVQMPRFLPLVVLVPCLFLIAKLSQAQAPAGLSLALFPNYPATRPGRPGRPDPTRPTRPDPTGIVFSGQYLKM